MPRKKNLRDLVVCMRCFVVCFTYFFIGVIAKIQGWLDLGRGLGGYSGEVPLLPSPIIFLKKNKYRPPTFNINNKYYLMYS